MTKPSQQPQVLCIGAGPAGLTAGVVLSKKGIAVTVLEKDPVYVGGISRTVSYKDYLIDIGGHRFFSKSERIGQIWQELLGDNLLERSRKSRIYYKGAFYHYPLQLADALKKLGIIESLRCTLSYLKAKILPKSSPKNFEEWVSNRFGRRLYRIFFQTYTEKIWGMKCTEISADWAAQRIKGLSLFTALKHALFAGRNRKKPQTIKSLIHTFSYPRKGPGMMWEAAAQHIQQHGGTLLMERNVTSITYDESTCLWKVTAEDAAGKVHTEECSHIISSMPLRSLINILCPSPTEEIKQAANSLKYRDFIIVALVVNEKNAFDDTWIYIHDSGVKVGRIQNFKSWSPEMVPDNAYNCYGMEYFCFEGDGLWASGDEELIALATKEIASLGLLDAHDVIDGHVIRQPKAYPVYDEHYQQHVDTIRRYLEAHHPTLFLAGRNGMHKYNNQDHAMMTALLAAENIMAGSTVYDVWRVNQDAEYLEDTSVSASGLRNVPHKA